MSAWRHLITTARRLSGKDLDFVHSSVPQPIKASGCKLGETMKTEAPHMRDLKERKASEHTFVKVPEKRVHAKELRPPPIVPLFSSPLGMPKPPQIDIKPKGSTEAFVRKVHCGSAFEGRNDMH